ncbi:MAG: multifunctional CCA addition/repair protein [Gammaproteobacteria bacterium]|nr:multifunctional CCA addition/repair protein [Gammaproteobacteria bacterium]MBU1654138.1 multifunctional CCA addition/repair protein [Gammaproteobacteria bacterium]MBU1960332.1 multifunctional CCA addition/repair protein [Gammaproteobacteria bacterium]
MKIYLVGGAVRDELLGRPVKERDWMVVGATPEAMLAQGFKQVGKDFPVFLHPRTGEEYALARTECKTAPGYRGFAVHAEADVTLEQDLLRRDLTINALARDESGQIIDPYGGLRDLESRLLRHVSDAFAEDPVRILRTARFAARYAHLGFRIAPETNALMQAMAAAGEVNALVPERVWQELVKVLAEETPSGFFEALRDCGSLRIVFPEIDRLFGVPQPAAQHPEIDTGIHSLMVLDQAARLSPDPRVRFAALCHDLGKGQTPAQILPSHHGHEERGATLAEQLCQRLKAPNDYRDLAILTARYHGHIHRVEQLRPQTRLRVLEGCDAFRRPERFEQLLLACEADARGRRGFEQRTYPQAGMFHRILAAARGFDPTGLVREGIKGEALKDAIRRGRLGAIRDCGQGADFYA